MKLSTCAAIVLIAGAAPLGPFSVHAQTSIKTGPAVGAKIPDFEAPDQNGAARTLRSVMGPKGAMVVFFRSADW